MTIYERRVEAANYEQLETDALCSRCFHHGGSIRAQVDPESKEVLGFLCFKCSGVVFAEWAARQAGKRSNEIDKQILAIERAKEKVARFLKDANAASDEVAVEEHRRLLHIESQIVDLVAQKVALDYLDVVETGRADLSPLEICKFVWRDAFAIGVLFERDREREGRS